MHIGIIGAGNIGSALAEKLVGLGHGVKIANSRGPATLGEVARKTGALAASVEDAVKDVAIVVVTIPQKNIPDLPRGVFAPGVVIVDTGNYYPVRDGRIPGLESGSTESGWVAAQIGRPVFKAFNSIMTHSFCEGSRPQGAKDRIALPVAGDDEKGKALLLELVDALGFDAVDAGALAESWRQEPGTPVYCTDLDAERVRRGLALADRRRSAERRDRSLERLSQLPPGAGPSDILAVVREIEEAPR